MEIDKILDGVLEEIEISIKKKSKRKCKTALTKKNKKAIKKASETQQKPKPKPKPPSPQPKEKTPILEEVDESIDDIDDIDESEMMSLGKNLKKINNKNHKNMYYISHKILHNFVEKMSKTCINIDEQIFEKYMSNDFNDIMMKFINNLNKKNKKALQKDLRCMGRKIDGQQCTRRKQDGNDYCQSHYKRLTNGRIDEAMKEGKKKNKRGRKRKVEFDPRVYDNDFVTVWADIVDGDRVLVDSYNNVYTYDVQKPIYLGKKSIEATLLKVPFTEVKN